MKEYIVATVTPQNDRKGYFISLEGGWGNVFVGAFPTDTVEPVADIGDVMLLDHAEVGKVTHHIYNVTKSVLIRKI